MGRRLRGAGQLMGADGVSGQGTRGAGHGSRGLVGSWRLPTSVVLVVCVRKRHRITTHCFLNARASLARAPVASGPTRLSTARRPPPPCARRTARLPSRCPLPPVPRRQHRHHMLPPLLLLLPGGLLAGLRRRRSRRRGPRASRRPRVRRPRPFRRWWRVR